MSPWSQETACPTNPDLLRMNVKVKMLLPVPYQYMSFLDDGDPSLDDRYRSVVTLVQTVRPSCSMLTLVVVGSSEPPSGQYYRGS